MSNIEKLIKELCPNGVEYKELKSVFEMRNGYTPSKAKAEFWEGGTIPWFRMEDIRENGNILSDSAQHITPAAVKGKLFPANSIIVATSATIGEHALITVESLANQRFTYLVRRPEYEEKLDPKFVYYYCYKLDEWCLNNTNISSFPSVDMAKFENGMKRLSVIKTPFNKTNIDRINRQMLKMSGQRDTLKERWNSALAVYDKMDIVDETEVKDKFVTSVVFWDAILTMILSGILCLIGAIGAGIVAAASQNGILAGTCYFFIAAGLAGIMIRFPKIFMLGSPLKRLKAFGNGIRKALEEQQLLEETHCKVETESNGPDNHIIYLSGGSGRDKALFAQCVNEFFDVIDNQRYILVKKKGHKGLNGFYAIPNCFSKKKEDAERFAKCMHD